MKPKLPEIDRVFFEKELLITKRSFNRYPLYITCNDLSKILNPLIEVASEEEPIDVYLKENLNFSGLLKVTEKETYDFYKRKFEEYCIKDLPYDNNPKTLKNLSKNRTEEFSDYPSNIRMFLVIENFNFYDKKSQYFFTKLSNYGKIQLIGQLRDDFDFVENYLDLSVRGNGSHFKIQW